MSKKEEPQPTHLQEGYQPKAGNTVERGYRPQGKVILDPKTIKPPKNWDTAVQPPKPPAGDKR